MRPGWVLAAVALLLMPRAAGAWGNEGHRIVALVADRVLQSRDPAVRAKLDAILATDKDKELTKTDIASEATWADVLREKSPEARAATAEWHYVRLDFFDPNLARDCFGRQPLPEGYPASHGPQANCVVDKLEQFVKELRDPQTSPEERLAALRYVLNLVGDVHEPLYAVERKDMNDNCVGLLLPNAKTPVRLSAYWDDVLVGKAGGKDPQKAAAELVAGLTPADLDKWSNGGPEAWAQESYAIAKATAYAFPPLPEEAKYVFPAKKKGEADACGPVPVYRAGAEYETRALATVKEQLTKAGVRLAFLLRESLQ